MVRLLSSLSLSLSHYLLSCGISPPISLSPLLLFFWFLGSLTGFVSLWYPASLSLFNVAPICDFLCRSGAAGQTQVSGLPWLRDPLIPFAQDDEGLADSHLWVQTPTSAADVWASIPERLNP